MNWKMELKQAPQWAIESLIYKPNAAIWDDNEHFQIVAYSYEKWETSTLYMLHDGKHDVGCVIYDTYFVVVDKEAKAIVAKTKNEKLAEQIIDRRTEEKLNRIDKILLEE